MSDSVETPSSSTNDTVLPVGTISPPGAVSLSPPIVSSLIIGGETSANNSAVPPSNDSSDSPPPPLSSPPPIIESSPPPSPPPQQSSPPLASSPRPTPPSESNPPPNESPPPTAVPAPPSLPTSPPPSSPHPSSPPPSPSSSSSHSPPPTPAQKSSPPSPVTAPPPPNEIVSPPEGTQQSPPSPTEFVPPPSIPVNAPPTTSPLTPPSPNVSPPMQSASGSPPISRGSTTNRSSTTSPAPRNSSDSSTTVGMGGDGSGSAATAKAVAGVAVASVVFVTIIAIFFAVRRRKKRQAPYGSHYIPPPNNFMVKTDGYYYGQQPQSAGFSGPENHSYVSNHSLSPLGDNYGSQRGNMYNGGGLNSGVIGGTKSYFSYDELMEITNGFSRQNILGEGGFGCVYKGWMPDGRVVAVKQLKAGSGQGDREFKAEVEIISRVHHRHLVSLVGYCISDNQRLLIYEFVPNKTLEHHLHAKGLPVLDWPKRLKIAIGSAKGLAYLHEDCHPKIIHRDIKSANILLDDAFEAQVADFGLAKLNDSTQTHVSTRVMGTFGYLAPEYASSGKLTDRSDVYSFGVVLLELITGRKPIDPTQSLGDESLVEWARPLLMHALETGDLDELVDPRLEKHYVESEMLRMIETAAACVRHSGPKRPRMVQVVRALDSDGEMSDLSNGVKYGQSTVYDSGQYNQDIMKFRRMALGSAGSSEYNAYSGDYTSRNVSHGQPTSGDYTSCESETRAINHPGPQQRYNENQSNYSGRRFI